MHSVIYTVAFYTFPPNLYPKPKTGLITLSFKRGYLGFWNRVGFTKQVIYPPYF